MCRWVAMPVLGVSCGSVVAGMWIAGSVIEAASPGKRLIPLE